MRKWIWLIVFIPAISRAERCDPPATIAEFVRHLPPNGEKRTLAIQEKLRNDPSDFWLNRLLLDASVYERSSIRDKYQKRFKADPSIENQYLYARSLVGFDTKEALRVYSAILERDPEYPWVRYSELEIYRSQAFRDRAKLRASFDQLARVCPAWIEPYKYLREMEGDAVAAGAERLRAMLERSANPSELRLYTVLWAAESRVQSGSARDRERERIQADLARLKKFDGVRAAIENGAKLIGDYALAKEMAAPPDRLAGYFAWQEEHPAPKSDDPPEKKQQHAQAELEASAKWIAMAPDEPIGYAERLRALAALDAPAEEIARAGDELVKVGRELGLSGHTFIVVVAQTYLASGIMLDRVPSLLGEALESLDDPEEITESDLAPNPELTQMNRMTAVLWHVDALATLSEYYEKQGQPRKAREILGPLSGYLATKKVPEGTRAEGTGFNLFSFRARAEYLYWFRLATLDEHQGRPEAALQNYRQALLVWDLPRDAVLATQRRLWKDLGRSDEAWQAWVDSIPPPSWRTQPKTTGSEFTAVRRPLPRVALKDLGGIDWPADRFNGKTTIAVVWATWCVPCVWSSRILPRSRSG